ncbi:MAG: DoxX family protein [Planctomycetota bacterium]|jgi:putative oxidoreductase
MRKVISLFTADNDKSKDAGLLVARLFFGGVMAAAHGLGKVPVSDGFIDKVGEMGLPAPAAMAWAAALSELIGGFCIAIGLFTRPAAFFLMCTMGVAAFVAHGDDPFQKKEMALCYAAASAMLLLAGAGRFSVDALLGRRGAE